MFCALFSLLPVIPTYFNHLYFTTNTHNIYICWLLLLHRKENAASYNNQLDVKGPSLCTL